MDQQPSLNLLHLKDELTVISPPVNKCHLFKCLMRTDLNTHSCVTDSWSSTLWLNERGTMDERSWATAGPVATKRWFYVKGIWKYFNDSPTEDALLSGLPSTLFTTLPRQSHSLSSARSRLHPSRTYIGAFWQLIRSVWELQMLVSGDSPSQRAASPVSGGRAPPPSGPTVLSTRPGRSPTNPGPGSARRRCPPRRPWWSSPRSQSPQTSGGCRCRSRSCCWLRWTCTSLAGGTRALASAARGEARFKVTKPAAWTCHCVRLVSLPYWPLQFSVTCRTLHPLWLFAGPGNRCLGIRNGGYDNNSKRFYSFKSRRPSCNLYKKQTGLIISVSHSAQRSTRYHSDALLHITCVFLTKRNKTLGLRKKAQLNKHAAMKQVKACRRRKLRWKVRRRASGWHWLLNRVTNRFWLPEELEKSQLLQDVFIEPPAATASPHQPQLNLNK